MALPPILASETSQALAEALARELAVAPATLTELVEAAERHSGKLRRKGLFQAFDTALGTKEP